MTFAPLARFGNAISGGLGSRASITAQLSAALMCLRCFAIVVSPMPDSRIRACSRLICPVAVFDFNEDGVQVREVRHGLTAADLQERLAVTLWAGPDLKELGTH